MTDARQQYLEECGQVARQHFDQNRMFVIYVRKRRPKFQAKPEQQTTDSIRRMLRENPSLTTSGYLGKIGASVDMDKSQKEQASKLFQTVRSVHRSHLSPKIGVIVGFQQDGQTMIGWSLCRTNSGDEFEKMDGIRRAIKRAVPLPQMQQEINETKQMLQQMRRDRSKMSADCLPVPHSCLSYLEMAVHRASTNS